MSFTEIRELAQVLVSVVQCMEEVRPLLDRFEAGEIGLEELLMELRGDSRWDEAGYRSSLL